MMSTPIESNINQGTQVKLKHLPQGLVVCGLLWGLALGCVLSTDSNGLSDFYFIAQYLKTMTICATTGVVAGMTLHYLLRTRKTRALIVEATLWCLLLVMIQLLLGADSFFWPFMW